MLPFDLRSRVDLGPAFKSLGWNKRGEKVSEGGLELVTATCLDAAAGGCAYCMDASLRSKAPSSAGMRSE